MMTRSRALGGVTMSDLLQDANVDTNLAQICGFDGMAFNGSGSGLLFAFNIVTF